MDIENQLIKVKVINFTEKHFQSLGYNVKNGDIIIIPAKHLPNGSGLKIDVVCNYCGKTFKKSWRRYLETKDNICCDECKEKKMMETSLNKYGNICSLRNPMVQQKSKEKNIKNLGVEYPLCSKSIRAKCLMSRRKNNNENDFLVRGSKNQQYLHKLFGGIYNYSISTYYLDIFFPEYKIYLEYDGSGHKLNIKLGNCSEEDFYTKEENRTKELLSYGLKEFRIISDNDYLPDDYDLYSIRNRAFYILLEKDFSIYTYNICDNIETFEI